MLLLDRRTPVELLPRLEALAEVVDFGAQLVERAYEASRKSTVDIVVLGVLLKQIVAMADGAEVLARAGAVHAAFLQARRGLEALLYLEWTLLGDSDYKADCYVMANMHHERLWSGRGVDGDPESIAFGKLAGEIGAVAGTPRASGAAPADPDRTYPALSSDALRRSAAEVEERFRKHRQGQWFTPYGADSLRRIAQQVGRLPQYHFWYAQEPHVTHSALFQDHVQIGGGEPRLRAIRGTGHADTLLRSTMQVLLGACASTLKHYHPDELGGFAEKYRERWRSQLLG